MNTIIYFSLAPSIYAAHCEGTMITILDARNDQYLSLIEDAALYFTKIVETPCTQENVIYKMLDDQSHDDYKEWNHWIQEFIEQGLIVASGHPSSRKIAPLPTHPDSLSEYQWDTKPSWKPFSKARMGDIIKTFLQLTRIHYIMKRHGIQGILHAIKKHNSLLQKRTPSEQEINALASAIDAASIIYPQKTFCLAWAATFVLCALKKGWDCSLVIGVQSPPFYAHAWASCNDKVIHDDPIIADALSPILKEPFLLSDAP